MLSTTTNQIYLFLPFTKDYLSNLATFSFLAIRVALYRGTIVLLLIPNSKSCMERLHEQLGLAYSGLERSNSNLLIFHPLVPLVYRCVLHLISVQRGASAEIPVHVLKMRATIKFKNRNLSNAHC